jgi:hypothetical protein
MKLTKWSLFTCRWFNLCANVTDFVCSKRFIFGLVLVISSFIFGLIFKYEIIKAELEWNHQVKVWQEQVKKEEIENKVKYIMQLYNCDSLTIYESLMNTFNPVLMAVIVGIESEYKINAISPANARGLTQCTLDKFRKNDKWDDPETNIRIGANYFKEMLKQFDGDVNLALAAYNAGPGKVIKSGYKVPNTKNDETINYVRKANKLIAKTSKLIKSVEGGN